MQLKPTPHNVMQMMKAAVACCNFSSGHKSQAATLIPTDKPKSTQGTVIVIQISENKQHSYEFSICPAAAAWTPARSKLILFGIKCGEDSSKNYA